MTTEDLTPELGGEAAAPSVQKLVVILLNGGMRRELTELFRFADADVICFGTTEEMLQGFPLLSRTPDLVIVGGWKMPGLLMVPELVRLLRRSYQGLMVSHSADRDFTVANLQAGCNEALDVGCYDSQKLLQFLECNYSVRPYTQSLPEAALPVLARCWYKWTDMLGRSRAGQHANIRTLCESAVPDAGFIQIRETRIAADQYLEAEEQRKVVARQTEIQAAIDADPRVVEARARSVEASARAAEARAKADASRARLVELEQRVDEAQARYDALVAKQAADKLK